MEKFAILIVGRGKLAAELLHGLAGPVITRVISWRDRDAAKSDQCIVVHAGSGRELNDVIGFCSATGAILLDLSTGGAQYSDTAGFPVVVCPNVNMQMLYFMAMIKHFSICFQGQDIRIAESHQASKNTQPGTAVYLAKALGVPETDIRSERDPKVQNADFGIPAAFLDRHAYHEILIKHAEAEIRLETRVLGKSAYASGLAKVIDIVVERRLTPGCYDIVDLIIDDL